MTDLTKKLKEYAWIVLRTVGVVALYGASNSTEHTTCHKCRHTLVK